MRTLLLCSAVLMLTGCVTYRDKVGMRRAQGVLFERGKAGDGLALACATEMAEVCVDVGADSIPEVEVSLTAEAASANAQGIKDARKAREALKGTAKAGLDWLGTAWPPAGVAISGLGALWALYRKGQRYRRTLETVVEGVGAVANKDTKSAIRNLAIDYGLQPFLDKVVQRVDPGEDA